MNSQTSHPHGTFPQLRHVHGACRGGGPGLQELLRPAVSPCVAGSAEGTGRLWVAAGGEAHDRQEPVTWSGKTRTQHACAEAEGQPHAEPRRTVTHRGRPCGSHPAPRSPPRHASRSSLCRRSRYHSASCPRPARPAGDRGTRCRGGGRHPRQCSLALVHKQDHQTTKETSMREKKEKTENTTQKIQIIQRT